MDNLRVIATLLIVATIAILSVFQMQIRGYVKVGRMEDWVLYIDDNKDTNCSLEDELIYEDDTFEYYVSCIFSESYIVKNGFEERDIIYVLEKEFITIEELDELIDIKIIEK